MQKFIFLLLLFSSTAFAEGDPWKRITHLNMVDGKVGLTLFEGDFIQDKKGPFFYVLNPTDWTVQTIEEQQYKSRFGSQTSDIAGAEWGKIPTSVRTSAGDIINLETSGCEPQEEGGPLCKEHYLSYNGKRIKLDLYEHNSVLFAERWDNQLWLGLGSLGELTWYGAGVQAYDIKSGRRIFTYNEEVPGGLLPSVIKRDSKTGNTWIATNLGIRIVDSHLKSTKSYFMHEEFNPNTGDPQIVFSTNNVPDDFRVTFARQLNLKGYKAFYAAIKGIPSQTLKSFLDTKSTEGSFAPSELNVLVPFLITGSESGRTNFGNPAQIYLCNLKDTSAANYFLERRTQLAPKFLYNIELGAVDFCLKKYMESRLIPIISPKFTEIEILKHEESQLEDLRWNRQHPDDLIFNSIIKDAYFLENRSNSIGWELIRIYIDPKYQYQTIDSLIGYMNKTLRGNTHATEIIAFALENLRGAFDTSSISTACNYFDQRAPRTLQQLYGEVYAKAILNAVKVLAKSFRSVGGLTSPSAKPTVTACVSAFKSQLADPGTRSKFMANVYPALDPADKKLVETLQQ